MSKIPDKRVGDGFAIRDHNRLSRSSNRHDSLSVSQGSGLVLKDTPSGRMLDFIGHFGLTPVICTAEDDPGAGLHTFSECNMAGAAVNGGKVLTSCWCVGDFDDDWVLSITTGEETFGLGFTYNGQNMVLLAAGAGNAYYYE